MVTLTAFTVMLLEVGVPLCAGAPLTGRPSPFATALAVIVPDTVTAADAPDTFLAAMVEGRVMFGALVEAVVGVPEMAIVTTVPLVRVAAAAVSPAGNPPVRAKSAGVIGVAYVPLAMVYVMLAPLTACPTLRLLSPVAATSMDAPAAVVIALLRTAAPAL